ncbi:diguanylate cyclase [Yoonia sp. BS5-3]|uniref:diguanylate cyclase n=1 Tax=Yoonia phaeophyticola TaxID=3137369 RepID=A0ABZ2V8P8_9RHOB
MRSSFNKTEWSVVVLVGTLLVCLIALAGQSSRARDDVIERAFENAEILADFFRITQEHYTESISGVPGVRFTIYPDAEPDALMYPATLGRRYTQSFNRNHADTQFKIYSNYPFVTSLGSELDNFAQQALDQLQSSEDAPIRYVETLPDNRRRVRYAVPIVMQEGCVNCHNSNQWELVRRNWEVGDVRGVREVSITLMPPDLYSRTEASLLLVLMFSASILGVFVVFPAVRREVKHRVLFHEMSIRAEHEAKTNLAAATTDALTQIGNRRFFDAEIAAMIKAHREAGDPLSLLMLDIDHFKEVNDQFGHDTGDYAIQAIARILKDVTRPVDRVARYGGEEFAVLVTGLDADGVLSIAERIRRNIAAHDFSHAGHDIRLTISIGATMLQPADEVDAFIKRADTLLYRAKESGRDQVCGDFATAAQ